MAYSQYFYDVLEQKVSYTSITDATPPTFAGITSVTPNSDGSITAAWSAGSTPKTPLEYEIFIALGSVSAATLFQASNLQKIVPTGTTSTKVFMLADQATYILNGATYTLGVRAKDALGYEDSNTAILTTTAIASGNLISIFQTVAASLAATETSLATDHANFQSDHANFQADHANFQADHTAFGTDHTNFQGDHTNFQGDHTNFQGDHTNFQADHTALQSDIADAQALADSLRPAYVASGAFVVNHQDLFQGTFWMAKNGVVMTSSLGTASYRIFDKTGAVVAGMSESGIVADSNGQFKITPVASVLGDSLEHYIIEVTVDADSANRIDNIPLIQKSVVYKCHSVFSINGSNQLLGTLWASIDDEMATSASLGTAAYAIYDASGVAVPGMSQSGIIADANGRFIITPVASSLADLTHYSVQISITVDGQLRVSNKGLTLAI